MYLSRANEKIATREPKQYSVQAYSVDRAECRICREEDNFKRMLSPCLCAGSCKYIHYHCLTRSIESRNADTCSICLARFKGVQTLTTTRSFLEFVALNHSLRNELIVVVLLLATMQASILWQYFRLENVVFLWLHSLLLVCLMLIYSAYVYYSYLDWVPDNLRVRVIKSIKRVVK